ncbi:molecular chaperone GrpE [Friedmanniella endophytica]|uniref:Protein GrpE n=1 Tax=Microlunatus kandeliicorticis TaxID=1759536 RepID=A0A7W3IQI8_9ACTN|nr:nucleotide exchange factor GrpE [Microlunatus kandeliicorticis]MBA8793398.1 molecular chaperone GrpE [Microlunatus kandeliicorticis]
MSDGSDRPTEARHAASEAEQEQTGPTVRDRRRIDPETGQVRPTQETAAGAPAPGGASAPEAAGANDEVTALQAALADRTSDLQRLQAEYVNYKRRVDRDRDQARQSGIEAVLRELLTTLDNVSAAREHEELSAGFRAVADDLERVTAKLGLVPFGQVGDAFDPHVHEALMHSHATEVNGEPITGPTCVAVLQRGYTIKDRVVRPARVAVAEPDGDGAAAPAAEGASPAEGE